MLDTQKAKLNFTEQQDNSRAPQSPYASTISISINSVKISTNPAGTANRFLLCSGLIVPVEEADDADDEESSKSISEGASTMSSGGRDGRFASLALRKERWRSLMVDGGGNGEGNGDSDDGPESASSGSTPLLTVMLESTLPLLVSGNDVCRPLALSVVDTIYYGDHVQLHRRS